MAISLPEKGGSALPGRSLYCFVFYVYVVVVFFVSNCCSCIECKPELQTSSFTLLKKGIM